MFHGKRVPGLVLLAGLLLAGPLRAHGVHSLGKEAPTAPAPASWKKSLRLIPSAKAALAVEIDEAGGYRLVRADGLPDHETGRFPNRGNPNAIRAQRHFYRMTLTPRQAGVLTPLRRQPFGIAINGVPFDPGTAEYFDNDPSSGWNVEAMGASAELGLDQNNAHVQPNGAYHYHGIPAGLLQRLPHETRPVLLGWAADGFPIYGPHGWRDPGRAGSGLIELRSGWRLKAGRRPDGPGGTHDGLYVQDYEYVAGLGDLDPCNGRTAVTPEFPQGTYHYVLTARFPFVPRCWAGTPDPSFERRGPPGGGPPGGGPPGGRPPPPFGRPPGPGR